MKNPKYPSIRFLVDSYYSIQNTKDGINNRIGTLKREKKLSDEICDTYRINTHKSLDNDLKWLENQIKLALDDYPIWNEWLKNIQGIGPKLAGGLIAWIYGPVKGTYKIDKHKKIVPIKKGKQIKYEGIKRFDTRAKLYQYCGYGTDENGKALKKKKGQQAQWNHKLKSHIWNVGKSFVKAGRGKSGYQKFYYEQKKKYRKAHPEKIENPEWIEKKKGYRYLYTDGHIDEMARRKTVKLFLSHLWEKWREMEGLPTESPYAIKKLKHIHYIPPYEK